MRVGREEGTVDIRQAEGEEELDAARTLIRAYIDWQLEMYADFKMVTDVIFEQVEPELVALPGPFAPPGGRLLLAHLDGEAVGVATFREKHKGVCIMHRMFVYPRFAGRGIGRALATSLIAEARSSGYEEMWLDTAFRQKAARSLYRSLGFKPVAPYFEMPVDWPEEIKTGILFLGLRL
jgi:GNAT superfamily N-acetyltransferase